MAKNYAVPHYNQKNQIKRFKLKVPFLEQEQKDPDSKELTLPQIEELLFREQMLLD